jgi:Cof subfamily protein (haloacid dehalogenase superfamily)
VAIETKPDTQVSYKLLALDIDGTLLTSTGQVASSTKAALERARQAGMLVTFATGRRLTTVAPLCRELGITLPVVLQTGAQIVEPQTGQVLYRNPLPREEVAAAVGWLVDEGLQPIVYENSALGQRLFTGPIERDSAPMGYYNREYPQLLHRLPYDELARIEDPLEIATINGLSLVSAAAARLELFGCRHLISYSTALDSYFLEIFHATCSKGEALRHLTQMLGLSMADVVAVGDNYNDREMLQDAGLGVAMANAEPEIIAIADRTTRSNDDDGIAALVDDLLSGQESRRW